MLEFYSTYNIKYEPKSVKTEMYSKYLENIGSISPLWAGYSWAPASLSKRMISVRAWV